MKNKKAISLLVSSVLLIVLALTLGATAYSYLKLYTPQDKLECPPDVSIIVEEAHCSLTYKHLSITTRNWGLFNVDALYIRFGDEDRSVLQQLNKGIEQLSAPLPPDEKLTTKNYAIPQDIVEETDYIIEVQPAILKDNQLVLCDNIIRETTQCVYDGPCGPHTDNGDGTCTAYLNEDYINEDGHITRIKGTGLDPDTYTRTTDGEDLLITKQGQNENNNAYIEWDISTIKKESDILEIQFKYTGEEIADNINSLIRGLTIRPTDMTKTDIELFNEIGTSNTGNIYLNDNIFPEKGTFFVTLYNLAKIDMEQRLTSGEDWIAIGVPTISTSDGKIKSEQASIQGQRPILIVHYDPDPTS